MIEEIIGTMRKFFDFLIKTSPINLFLWIIGIIILFFYFWAQSHNWWIKRKYKIEKKGTEFKIIRDPKHLNDVYIVYKEEIWHHIEDPYTLNKLGFTEGMMDKNGESSVIKFGRSIKIYNIIAELGQIKVLTEKFSNMVRKEK